MKFGKFTFFERDPNTKKKPETLKIKRKRSPDSEEPVEFSVEELSSNLFENGSPEDLRRIIDFNASQRKVDSGQKKLESESHMKAYDEAATVIHNKILEMGGITTERGQIEELTDAVTKQILDEHRNEIIEMLDERDM